MLEAQIEDEDAAKSSKVVGSDATTLDDDADMLPPSQPTPSRLNSSLHRGRALDTGNDVPGAQEMHDANSRTPSQSLLTQHASARNAPVRVCDTQPVDVDVISQTPESQYTAVTCVPETMEDSEVEERPRIGSMRLSALSEAPAARDVTPRRKALRIIQTTSPAPR